MQLPELDKKILVLGDTFLDEYIHGTCTRLSQEAPVPILEVNQSASRFAMGGAGNTAANVRSLGGRCSLLTRLCPSDSAGSRLISLAFNQGVDLDWVTDRAVTARKIRVVGNGQQLLRMDYEEKDQLSALIRKSVLGLLSRHIEKSSVVVLSDYAKGFFSPDFLLDITFECQRLGKPVVVDPKAENVKGYFGVSYVTPNLKEMAELVPSIKDPDKAAVYFSTMNHCAVLLTKGEKGITFVRGGELIGTWPAVAKEVFDVSGAGDTVVAAFSLALASGAKDEDAIEFANKAAGVVVGKHGTATVTREEIK